ncbi:MAG: HAD family hydrolase [Bdellovibrionota bacterium]
MAKKAVIFDMDGVLVDSNAAHFEAFRKIGEQLGVPFTRELLEQTVGMHNNQIFPLWLGPGLNAERALELAVEKEAIYRQLARGKLKAIPGALTLVQALHRQGVALAVGSSGPRANVELAVETLGLGPYFRTLITGDDVKRGKPAPDIFLLAASRLGFLPEDCVVLEDAPQGVQAALSAKMKVVAVTTSRPASALAAAHLVLDTLELLNPADILG